MLEKYKQSVWQLLIVLVASFVLALILFKPVSAQDYSCGAYGAGDYGQGEVCAAATPDEDGGLTDTGQALSFIIPALAILAGVAIMYRLSRKRKSASKQ